MKNPQQLAFVEEARDLLADLETTLLELEKSPADTELMGQAFRSLHTIKGSGAMFGFDQVAAFTHDIENTYEQVRSGRLAVSKQLVDLTLAACDDIRGMIEDSDGGGTLDLDHVSATAAGFRDFLGQRSIPDPAPKPTPIQEPAPGRLSTYRIRFRPAPHIFASGTNPLLLLEELRGLGPCQVVANTDLLPSLDVMDPEQCYTAWDVLLTTSRGINAIRDVFIFIEDDCELTLEAVDDDGPDYRKLGEILVDRGDVSAQHVQQALSSQKRLGEILVESGVVSSANVKAALAEQQAIREVRQQRLAEGTPASIRVPAEKLDTLVNMVGELVTVQSRLNALAASLNHPALTQVAEDVERLTAELRDNTMSIRMLPIGTTFKKFERLLRDLCQELGKEVDLTTTGGETELDKTVIERLNDPLVHLIRNAIDHGIEPPEVRERLGKATHGTVRLSARHEGASVIIQMQDDGAGINLTAIRQKAIERGLVAPDAVLADKDALGLIFLAGLSTAPTVTSVSGRGVGLDVVKRSIDALGGSLEVDSVVGAGTTFTMKLPLTLAIIDGLLVKLGDAFFVLPLAAIEECVELTREEVASRHGQHLAFIRGELVPYISLRQRFKVPGASPPIEQIVTTRIDGTRVGLLVDQVVGQHQTVIKSVGRCFKNVEEVSGATVLGDGSVALILDLPKLIHKVEREEAAPKRAGALN